MIELSKLICSHKPRCEFQTIVWEDLMSAQPGMLACRYCGKVVNEESGVTVMTPHLANNQVKEI